MSGLIPAFALAAFGDVGLLPISFIEQFTVQYFLFLHLAVKNSLLQAGQIFLSRGTIILPFRNLADSFGLPVKDKDIFSRHSSVNGPLFRLLWVAEQLCEQNCLGSKYFTLKRLLQSTFLHFLSSTLALFPSCNPNCQAILVFSA